MTHNTCKNFPPTVLLYGLCIICEYFMSNFFCVIKVKSLCLTKHHAMKTYRGGRGIATRSLDLGTRWRRVVSFTSRPFYPQRKSPWYPLDMRLSWPQSRIYSILKRYLPVVSSYCVCVVLFRTFCIYFYPYDLVHILLSPL
jgi:hypothetical protein